MSLKIHVTERGLQKIRSGHPWIFADEIKNKDALPTRPSLIWFSNNAWFCSPKSFIRLRRLGPPNPYSATKCKEWGDHDQIDLLPALPKDSFNDSSMAFRVIEEWLHYLLSARLDEKTQKMKSPDGKPESCFRWIFSENDYLPGLIIDVFGSTLVCQINTAPIDWMWLHLKDVVIDVFKKHLEQLAKTTGSLDTPARIEDFRLIELRNSSHRKQEGLAIIPPEDAEKKVYSWNGFLWEMAPGGKQKTGAYLDQKDNHLRTAELAEKWKLRTAWDVCSFEGGFTLHLLKNGLSVTAVDQSETALEQVRRNTELNKLLVTDGSPAPMEKTQKSDSKAETARLETIHADFFEFLREKNPAPQVDLIVLDPPSFVKNPKMLKPAIKGYMDLHVEAMKRLNPGGLLVTCSCSHAISETAFKDLIQQSAKIADRDFELIESHGPCFDHQPEPNFPEGRYLQAHFLRCGR